MYTTALQTRFNNLDLSNLTEHTWCRFWGHEGYINFFSEIFQIISLLKSSIKSIIHPGTNLQFSKYVGHMNKCRQLRIQTEKEQNRQNRLKRRGKRDREGVEERKRWKIKNHKMKEVGCWWEREEGLEISRQSHWLQFIWFDCHSFQRWQTL